MKLIGYFRSSAAFRVRIALNLKGISVTKGAREAVTAAGGTISE